MKVLNIRQRRDEVYKIIRSAALAYVLNETPSLASGPADAITNAVQEVMAGLKISESFLRVPISIPYGSASVPPLVFNPKVTTNAQNRTDFQGLNQEDLFIGYAEDLLIDGRISGNNGNADYRTFPDPIQLLTGYAGVGPIYTTAAKMNTLLALYTGTEGFTVNSTTYRPYTKTRKYLRYPKEYNALTIGAATAAYNLEVHDTESVDTADYTLIAGNKTSAFNLNIQPVPAIAIPDATAGTELDITKVVDGFLIQQGNVLYDSLMGAIIS